MSKREEEKEQKIKAIIEELRPLNPHQSGLSHTVYESQLRSKASVELTRRNRQAGIEGLSKAGQKGGTRRREQGDSPMRDRKNYTSRSH